jgi:hypothetical protein
MSNNRGRTIMNTNRLINELTKYRNNLAAYKAQKQLNANLPGPNIPNIPVNPNAAALENQLMNNMGGVPATPTNNARLRAVENANNAFKKVMPAAIKVNKSALKLAALPN